MFTHSFSDLPLRPTYPHFRLYDDGFVVLFRHQDAGGERGLDHVDDQIIGQNVQLLHLVPRHIGAARDAVPDESWKIKTGRTGRFIKQPYSLVLTCLNGIKRQ